ncbi:MAG: penicillin-binding protein 1C [Roseibium sp.]|nr:penicillin-binding protein 1C [Roseibium sp.]
MAAKPVQFGRWVRRQLGVLLVLILIAGGVAGAIKGRADMTSASAVLRMVDLPVSTVVLDRRDRLLRAFLSDDDKWRLPVRLEDVDPFYLTLLIAFEDRRFFQHNGIDWRALVRAAAQFAVEGHVVSGGSTLTMQVARLLTERPTRSLGAKYTQMLQALALEDALSKDKILELYLLRAPFGGNLEGVRAASLTWFGKEPGRLTPAEAALLVALPQAPEGRRPDRFFKNAKAARARVLDRAVAAGLLSSAEAAAAKRERLPSHWRPVPRLAPHTARAVASRAPEQAIHRLTLDRDLQSSLETLARDRAATFADRVSLALLVADHSTGEVLTSVGAPDLLDGARLGHVDMTEAIRSPGSTLKPLIYGLAFEDRLAHPESLIDDRPVDFAGYKPTNFDRSYQGPVSVREALQLSLNTPAVQFLEAVGPARLLARFKRAGIAARLPRKKMPGLAIGLGGIGLSLKDLVALYAALARLGDPIGLRIERPDGSSQPDMTLARRPLLSKEAAWQVMDILTGLPQPHAAGGARIAYKTGTAYGHRDAWALGFDGRHVIGVWVGRADGTPVSGQTGAKAAAPILFEAFQRLGPERAALPRRPDTVLAAAHADLPAPLRRARLPEHAATANASVADGPDLRIAYPPDGATIDLGHSVGGDPMPLVVKLTGGTLPFSVLIDGAPAAGAQRWYSRQVRHDIAEKGFVSVAVIDAAGRTASLRLRLK